MTHNTPLTSNEIHQVRVITPKIIDMLHEEGSDPPVLYQITRKISFCGAGLRASQMNETSRPETIILVTTGNVRPVKTMCPPILLVLLDRQFMSIDTAHKSMRIIRCTRKRTPDPTQETHKFCAGSLGERSQNNNQAKVCSFRHNTQNSGISKIGGN